MTGEHSPSERRWLGTGTSGKEIPTDVLPGLIHLEEFANEYH